MREPRIKRLEKRERERERDSDKLEGSLLQHSPRSSPSCRHTETRTNPFFFDQSFFSFPTNANCQFQLGKLTKAKKFFLLYNFSLLGIFVQLKKIHFYLKKFTRKPTRFNEDFVYLTVKTGFFNSWGVKTEKKY